MDIQQYLKDYYLLKINMKEISEKLGVSRSKLQNLMKESGTLTNRQIYSKLNTGIKELDVKLKDRYSGIVKRCNDYPSYEYGNSYKDLEYLTLYEWVDFCMDNKELLLQMWDRFIESDRNMQLTISIDRIDNDKGYLVDNMQFITNGLNGYKRNINPVKVIYNNKESYFMTGKEASRYYGIRENTIGDILRGEYRLASKDYQVENSDIKTVLEQNNVDNLNDYYEGVYLKEGDIIAI